MRYVFSFVTILILSGCTSALQGAEARIEAEVKGENSSALALTSTSLLTSTSTPTWTPMPTNIPTRAPASTPTATLTPEVKASRSASPTTTASPTTAASSTATASPTTAASPTVTSTATPARPELVVLRNANLRGGPGTVYPIIGAARAGDRLAVTGRYRDWWRVALPSDRTAWLWGNLAEANGLALRAPTVTDIPPTPQAKAKAEVKVEAKNSSLPDLVVLGPDTVYPVRARVVRGWDYEFVDLSEHYDIVVYRDVFGMLSHQIDDENRLRYWPNKPPIGTTGPIRITLIDAQPHPDPACPGWGWAPDRETYIGDPLGMMQEPCLVQHALFPLGDGHGAVLWMGAYWGIGYTVAVAAYGPTGADWSTTFFAERITWPATLGPADRPDFALPLYAPLGGAHKEDGRWVWHDPFVQIVPAAR